MLTLTAKIREITGKKTKLLKQKGLIPAVLYGQTHKKPLLLEVDFKTFEKTYKEAGESSLISLEIDKTKNLVLIHEIKTEPLSGKIIHIDFYQPRLDEETEATIPLVFEGEAIAVKELKGTLVKNIYEVEVEALPQNLPKEIKVNIEKLKSFEDTILIKDLIIPKEVKILKDPDEIVALVTPIEEVEEELKKPVEEKVEEVEKVEKKKKEEPNKESNTTNL